MCDLRYRARPIGNGCRRRAANRTWRERKHGNIRYSLRHSHKTANALSFGLPDSCPLLLYLPGNHCARKLFPLCPHLSWTSFHFGVCLCLSLEEVSHVQHVGHRVLARRLSASVDRSGRACCTLLNPAPSAARVGLLEDTPVKLTGWAKHFVLELAVKLTGWEKHFVLEPAVKLTGWEKHFVLELAVKLTGWEKLFLNLQSVAVHLTKSCFSRAITLQCLHVLWAPHHRHTVYRCP